MGFRLFTTFSSIRFNLDLCWGLWSTRTWVLYRDIESICIILHTNIQLQQQQLLKLISFSWVDLIYKWERGWESNSKTNIPYNSLRQYKISWCTFNQQMKDLYNRNLKSLQKEIQEDIRKRKCLPGSWIVLIIILKMAILPKANYRFKIIPIKIPTQFFTDLERTVLNFLWKINNPGQLKNPVEYRTFKRHPHSWLNALPQVIE